MYKILLTLSLILLTITAYADNITEFVEICLENHKESSKTFGEDWRPVCECNAYLSKNVFGEEKFKEFMMAIKDNKMTPKLVAFMGSMSKDTADSYYSGVTDCLTEFSPIKSLMLANINNCIEHGKTLEKCSCLEKSILEVAGDKKYRKLRAGDNFEQQLKDLSEDTRKRIIKSIDICNSGVNDYK